MVVLEIKDKVLTDKYSKEELNYIFSKVIDFLKTEEKKVNLYSMNLEDAPFEVQEAFKKPDNEVNYVNY